MTLDAAATNEGNHDGTYENMHRSNAQVLTNFLKSAPTAHKEAVNTNLRQFT